MTDAIAAIAEARSAAIRELEEIDAQILSLRERRNRLHEALLQEEMDTRSSIRSLRRAPTIKGGVRQRKVLEALEVHGPMWSGELAKYVFGELEIPSAQPQTARICAKLRDSGYITKVGGVRGKWKLVRNFNKAAE